MGKCYEMVSEFKRKYPLTIAFRLEKHCAIVEKHLNPDEEILYAFPAQKIQMFLKYFIQMLLHLQIREL